MELRSKLKHLRTVRGMTQEEVAEALGVSSQTVSKWERGLISPDISLLPKIAMLFRCSIDSLFDMNLAWSTEHRQEFKTIIHELHEKKDWEGVYQAWIREIELNPDHYGNYADVMLHVYRRKLYDKGRVEKMISLADHAEKCCADDDKRNEIYRIMLQICSESKNPAIRKQGRYYYQKLPALRHSREVYARLVMEGEEYRTQILKNIIYTVDLAECSVRQLMEPDMLPEERLFYYQKAAALYEVVLDGKYAGFFDPPLLYNYYEIARCFAQLGCWEQTEKYVNRILEALEKHVAKSPNEEKSKLLYATTLPNAVPAEQSCQTLLKQMVKCPELENFREPICDMLEKFQKNC